VTFDPFGDFETRGYLRNLANEKDLKIVRRLEHTSFITGIDAAFGHLATIKRLSYRDVLDTHKMLFEAVYPWAGQDRLETAPDLAVGKGPVLFARPEDIRRAVDFALEHGQDKTFMAAKPGEIMGYLA
jgi:cell filamentation protein